MICDQKVHEFTVKILLSSLLVYGYFL